jgi:two-component system, LytTR family, sensor kinase
LSIKSFFKSSKSFWVAHSLFWAVVHLYNCRYYFASQKEFWFILWNLPTVLIGFSITFLYHKTLEWRKVDLLSWKKVLPYALACIFLAGFYMFYYEEWMIQYFKITLCDDCDYNRDFRNLPILQVLELVFQEAVFYVLPWVLVYHLAMANRQLNKKKIEVLDTQNLMRIAELENLKNQLNPHFLFNSLNGIRSLIYENQQKADEMLTNLSELLRASFTLGKKDLISLSEELELVNDYVALEKMRYEERLRFNSQVEEQLANTQIPPFIIQQLVENAIKHGAAKLEDGGKIDLFCSQKNDFLEIKVVNCALKLDFNEGTGLVNIKKRLALYFGEKASMNIAYSSNSQVTALINIPIKKL